MSIDLIRLGTMVKFVISTAVKLSVWIGILGYGHPISMRVWRIGTIYLAVMNNPEISPLVAEDMTYLIMCAMVSMGPLWRGTGSFPVNMMLSSTRLHALLTLRYAASEWVARIISLDR